MLRYFECTGLSKLLKLILPVSFKIIATRKF